MNATTQPVGVDPVSTYTPTDFVQYGLTIPKQSYVLLRMAGVRTRTGTRFQLSTEYYITLAGLPVVFFLLAIVSMALMSAGLVGRVCCRWLACFPQKYTTAQKKKRQRILYAAVVFCAVILLGSVALFVVVAAAKIDGGLSKAQSALGSLRTLLEPIGADMEVLKSVVGSLGASLAITRAQCTGQAAATVTLATRISSLASSTTDVATIIKQVIAQITSLDTYLAQYLGDTVRKYMTYVLGIVPALLGLLFVLLPYCEASFALKGLVGFSVVYYYLQALLLLPISLIVSLLADVCDDPFQKILGAVGGPSSVIYNMTHYYSTCVGGNPAVAMLVEARLKANSVQLAVQSLLLDPSCSAMPAAATALRSINLTAAATARNITQSLLDVPACTSFRSQYADLVGKAVCGDFFSGIFVIAAALLLGSFALWMCVVLTALLYPHFDPLRQQQVYVKGGDEDQGGDGQEGFEEDDEGDGFDDDDDDDGAEEKKAGDIFPPMDSDAEPKVTSFDWRLLEEEISKGRDADSAASTEMSRRFAPSFERLGSANPFGTFDEEDGASIDVSQITQQVTQEDYLHAIALNDAGLEDEH